MRSPYFTEDHDAARESIRQFVENAVLPNAPVMEREGRVPGFLWQELGKNGYLSLGHDEAYGGRKSDIFGILMLVEELARTGLGGFCEAFLTHTYMVLSFIDKFGNRFIKRNYLAPGITGQKIGAMALIEPPVASETARLKISARQERQHYCLEGSITFVSNGGNADFFVVAARTDQHVRPGGISLFVVDKNLPGIRIHPTHTVGWHSADFAETYFDNVKVSGIQLIGQENMGLYYLNECYLLERLLIAAAAITQADYCLESTLRYINNRHYHRPGIFPAYCHPLANMAAEIEAIRQLVYYAAWLYEEGLQSIKQCSMAKLLATETLKKIADQCVQLIGKNALRENSLISSLFRDAHMGTLSHGATEMMLEIIAKLLIDSQSSVTTGPFLSPPVAPGDTAPPQFRNEKPPDSKESISADALPGFTESPPMHIPPAPEGTASTGDGSDAAGPTQTTTETPGISGPDTLIAPATAPEDASMGHTPDMSISPETPADEPPQDRPDRRTEPLNTAAAEPGTTAELPPEVHRQTGDISGQTAEDEAPAKDPDAHREERIKSSFAKFAEDLLSEDDEEMDDLDSDIIAAMERAFARQQEKLKAAEPADETALPEAPSPDLPGATPPENQTVTAEKLPEPPPVERPEQPETPAESGPVIVRQPSRKTTPQSRDPHSTTANSESNGIEPAAETAFPGATEDAEPDTGKSAADEDAVSTMTTIHQQVHELMHSLPERFDAAKAAGFSAVIHFQIADSDETYSVNVENGHCSVVNAAAGQPTCITRTSAQTFVDMETGKINPQVAFMMGRMEISNVPQMMQFIKLFRKAPTA